MLNVANFLSNSEELKAQRTLLSDGIAPASITKKMLPNKPQAMQKSPAEIKEIDAELVAIVG